MNWNIWQLWPARALLRSREEYGPTDMGATGERSAGSHTQCSTCIKSKSKKTLFNVGQCKQYNINIDLYSVLSVTPSVMVSHTLSSTLPEIDPDTAYVVCISVSLGFPYMVSVFPCFPYMISICPYFLIWQYNPLFWVWRCYGLLWTLHCHKDRYCDVTMIWPLLFHGICADVSETPTTPWQRECTVFTDCQSIDSLQDSMRFVTHFWEITPYILRDAIVGWVQSLGLCNKCSGLRPSAILSLIELGAWPATSCARGWAILW